MGQAKINKALKASLPEIPEDILSKVSSAIRRLSEAASAHLGADCYLHAAIAANLLQDEGYKVSVVSGEAGWRVGEGDSDAIMHLFDRNRTYAGNEFPYHTWLEYGDRIIDFTVYQFQSKAQSLEAMDGQHMQVDWTPDYLNIKKDSVSSAADVIQKHTGMYHYRRDPIIEAKVNAAAFQVDPGDMAHATLLYHNPDINVIGPNHMRPKAF